MGVAPVHHTLKQMLAAGQFEPYIRYIRFPHFRNLREGTRIEFDHPITALVGPNGTNKTAILRALQGCPDYYNVGQYWFSTELDPIKVEERHRFIHGYWSASQGAVVEAIKTRIAKPGNPDYFEPSRPLLRDGMAPMPPLDPSELLPPDRTRTRWKSITKSVVYLDFRSELSAYDKYFYHLPPRRRRKTSLDLKLRGSQTDKKSTVRRRSKYLAASIRHRRSQHMLYRRNRIIEPPREVTDEQRKAISEILGRDYVSITVIRHGYFDVEGATVVLATDGLRYSEAFAGSGEFAVTMLVLGVMQAPPKALILLDEPEVSLHPGAQRKLMAFLASEAKLHRHQIVISTHSPEIIRDLPPSAIKVFLPSATDGKIELLSQSANPEEAFFRLGVEVTTKKRVYVEDGLASAIVRRAMRPQGQGANVQFEVVPLPGGTNTIQTRFIPAFALSGHEKCLVLLDGDQRPEGEIPNVDAVPDVDLADVLKGILHGEVQLSLSGHLGESAPGERIRQQRQILAWVAANVDYLPGKDPESLLLDMAGESWSTSAGSKATWERKTRESLGRAEWETVSSSEILGEQERALARLPDDAAPLVAIRERVVRFLSGGPT